MFERYLTDALTKQFGHLLDDVDPSKLSLSAWNGSLVLEDVFLRTDVLDSFVDQCPLELAFGRIGRLELQVPWSLVGSQLWRRRTTKNTVTPSSQQEEEALENGKCVSIVLSDVNILLTPRRKTQETSVDTVSNDESTHQKQDNNDGTLETTDKMRERKEKIVQEMLDAQLLSRVALSSQQTSRWKWVQDWISSLLSKISVTSKNIHIRYEDPGHSMGFVWNSTQIARRKRSYRKQFAIGITLREFTVTNRSGKEGRHDLGTSSSSDAIEATQTDITSVRSSTNDGDQSLESTPSSEEQVQEGAEGDVEKENMLDVTTTVASAKKLAIYWDSDGTTLISESATTGESENQANATKELGRQYVSSAFSVLNGDKGTTDEAFLDGPHYNNPHNYLLDPTSPAVQFDIVSLPADAPSVTEETTSGGAASQHSRQPSLSFYAKPSSIKITLSPTVFAVSRQTLEDIVYLRKSLDVWTHAKKGILSDKSLKWLASLRPKTNAVDNPRGWWKYAAAATMALIQAGRNLDSNSYGHGATKQTSSPFTRTTSARRRSGWIRLARALACKKRYVALYKEFFNASARTTNEDEAEVFGPFLPPEERRERVHQSLLLLEDQLTVHEIAAFRIVAHKEIARDSSSGFDFAVDATTYTSQILSPVHRYQMFVEMAQALDTEMLNTQILNREIRQQEERHEQTKHVGLPKADAVIDPAAWKVSLSCAELSLQVNDKQWSKSKQAGSIVRLSCACVLESDLYRSGSWKADWSVAALAMDDLTEKKLSTVPGMKTLIGPKADAGGKSNNNTLFINDMSFQENMRVSVSRTVEWQRVDGTARQIASATNTRIRLLPLEITYSTIPLEALSRVLATVKTPELSDDYHRMASRVYEWRERQKRRFLDALANQGKKIFVHVDVNAPVLLIPESVYRADSPLLVLDLGHLHFSNVPDATKADVQSDLSDQYDDVWSLALTDVQMQCTTTRLYHQKDIQKDLFGALGDPPVGGTTEPQQVVESFSLDFTIYTRVAEHELRTNIAAVLPKLNFNITSSSVRLINRLRQQWMQQRSDDTKSNGVVPKLQKESTRLSTYEDQGERGVQSTPDQESKVVEQYVEFRFSAPTISIKLANDSDKIQTFATLMATALPEDYRRSTEIVTVSIRGVGGSFVQSSGSRHASTRFQARLHSLRAMDHYQSCNFAHLLSSFDPAIGSIPPVGSQSQTTIPPAGKDLVLVEYTSVDEPDRHHDQCDTLSIQFHELYVEWNPETIAAIQKALRTPKEGLEEDEQVSSETALLDEFFDAEEIISVEEDVEVDDDVFFDTLDPSFYVDATSPLAKLTRQSTLALLASPETQLTSCTTEKRPINVELAAAKPFETVFQLMRLRVNFNKESRHRRLFTAEMDRTFVASKTLPDKSITTARLGNLVFYDPSRDDNETLYGQILGLQNSLAGNGTTQLSSLLELELVSVAKQRHMVERRSSNGLVDALSEGVSLCYNNGSVRGYDTHMKAHLSPMRFVYLSQLWSEIVDYFFEGILGYEVLGSERPASQPPSADADLESEKRPLGATDEKATCNDDDPFGVSFTVIDIVIDSPEVLFPVTYRSPHFLKLQAASITLSNYFECKARSYEIARWHNNYNISFDALRILSWDGSEVSHSKKKIGALINIRWPTGACAHLEDPKWNVNCKIDNLDFTLRRYDYSLLQDIVSYNLGEESRHLYEWHALLDLHPDDLDRYKQSIMVHYGYDTKDDAPTTYSISLLIDMVTVHFEGYGGSCVAIAQCSEFGWEMTKPADCVSRQTVDCKMRLVHPTNPEGGEELLLSSKESPGASSLPKLIYRSTTAASGNHVKDLHISDACIYVVYPAWTSLLKYFADLPTAEMFTPEQVGLSMQIGDRWYKIAESPKESPPKPRQFSWIGKEEHPSKDIEGSQPRIEPSYQLRILLTSPHIIVSSSPTETETISLALRLSHLDYLYSSDGKEGLSTSLFSHDLELYTSSQDRRGGGTYSESSLIHPWCFSMSKTSNCESQSTKVACDILKARLSFSDMVSVVDVCLGFIADIRQTKAQETDTAATSATLEHSESGSKSIEPCDTSVSEQEPGTGREVLTADLSGFELLLVDDSGRQFATSQDLIMFVVERILFCREDNNLQTDLECGASSRKANVCRRMVLCMHGPSLLDCLQPQSSQFRLLATCRRSNLEGEGTDWENVSPREEKMRWESFAMQTSTEWGFMASRSLLERTDPHCFADLSLRSQGDSDAIILRSFEDDMNLRSYSVAIKSLMMQYNPSTVIALQRFGGRFRKQAVRSIDSFNEEINKLMEASSHPEIEDMQPPSNERIKLEVEIERLALCMNKEHQNRRLLRVVLFDCAANIVRDASGMVLEAGVREIEAWDCDHENQIASWSGQNACLLRTVSYPSADEGEATASKSSTFLRCKYCTFSGSEHERHDLIPPWLRSHVSASDGSLWEIDDFLEVQMGTVEITYLRERTEEIIDYLQHGLPGKGMGATSRAAQGFIEQRIRTKSFLHLEILSPNVMIPRNENSSSGLQLRLGDIDVKSWFEGGTSEGRINQFELSSGGVQPAPEKSLVDSQDQSDWWRLLSLQISNFQAGVFESNALVDALSKPLALSLVLQKSAWHNRKMSLRCRVSLVDMTLKYSQYCLLSAVVDGNIGKVVNKERWDNIEKAYNLELEAEGQISQPGPQPRPVEYASGARHVRFGAPAHVESHPHPSGAKTTGEGRDDLVDLQVTLDGFQVKFHRDDLVTGQGVESSSFPYDLALLKIHLVEVSIDNNISQDFSLQLALYRIYLFDLGEEGRLGREVFHMKASNRRQALRPPCAFAVLVEGYSNEELEARSLKVGEDKDVEPQLVITMDKVPASSIGTIGSVENSILLETGDSKVTVAKVVLNYLSVNALVRPFTELASFLSLSWPSPLPSNNAAPGDIKGGKLSSTMETDDGIQEVEQSESSSPGGSCMQLKLVAHHPRIFFCADECDPHSRALVLKGLAVINASRTMKNSSEMLSTGTRGEDIRNDLIVDAQLHSLESYINPDVNGALRLQQRHHDLLNGCLLPPIAFREEGDIGEGAGFDFDDLGVALLQPVTAGVEFGTMSRTRFPTRRYLCINIEPISTMLSFADLQLLELVYNRWVKRRHETPPGEQRPRQEGESKSFESEDSKNVRMVDTTLAYDVVFDTHHLGLRLKKDDGFVVVEDIDTTKCRDVHVGDILARIEGQQVPQAPLGSIVQQLAETPRPTTITFLRRATSEFKAVTAGGTKSQVDAHTHELELKNDGLSRSKGNKFTVHFKCGISNGLSLERSCVQSIPVVSRVDPSISKAILPTSSEASERSVSQRYPVAGLLVLQLNGQDITESNFSDSVGVIGLNGLRDEPLEPYQNGSDSYAVTFMEVDSSSWGYVDSFDISFQGAALTFIDDLNGKDMPMLRGSLNSLEAHCRSGIGINTSILERTRELPGLALYTPSDVVRNHSSVSVTALARTTIEYYEPLLALYEPLLEPAQFCLKYDCHSGDEASGTPSQVALEVSDGASGKGDAHVICINVSDSSSEVLAKALREWKTWRKMVEDTSSLSLSDATLQASQSSIREGIVDPTASGKEVLQSSYVAGLNDFEASAAQAAFRFAQKRGAERSGKGESSKPFEFRNRTGVSIAFVQENADRKDAQSFSKRRKSQNSFVGEYYGLDRYDRDDIIELADGSDVKFQMDFLPSSSKPLERTKNKVRTYEGQFSSLRVSIQSIAGVTIEALLDLQVHRAGSWIRNLSVRKVSDNKTSSQFTVPMVWKVNVEDNRRILTLSSAVRIVSLNASVIEIGVRAASATHLDPSESSKTTDNNKSAPSKPTHAAPNGLAKASPIQFIGVSLPDSPFYLPLWLAMRLESVQIYVRPKFPGLAQYQWGQQCVLTLQFNSLRQTAYSNGTEWIWKETLDETLASIHCQPKEEGHPSAFLSCFTSSQMPSDMQQVFQAVETDSLVHGFMFGNEILSVSIDAGLSIRNLLPLGIEFQAGHALVNHSTNVSEDSRTSREMIVASRSLMSGECAEVYACDFKAKETLAARFRIKNEANWSPWTPVSSPPPELTDNEADPELSGSLKATNPNVSFQTNVHVEDDFGVPIVLGVRVIPKVAKKSDWDRSSVVCYGVDVVVYAELWISNLTSLPLSFGCPRQQIYADGKEEENYEDATKFSAEAALMEIASVLELGENGTELDTRNADRAATAGEIYLLPHQTSQFTTEEVFEYEELTQQALIVKRRWWASENFSNLRHNRILEVNDGISWRWLDNWKIDCAGGADSSAGGWESCKDLLGVGDGPFSGHRQFMPSHPFRRRRWYRNRGSIENTNLSSPIDESGGDRLLSGLQAFHQPIRDSFSRAQMKARKKRKKRKRKGEDPDDEALIEDDKVEVDHTSTYEIAVKCGDGRWGVPATVSSIGSSHGTLQLFASRWPSLTNMMANSPSGKPVGFDGTGYDPSRSAFGSQEYGVAPLNPTLYELSYQVSDIDGEWGDFSRHLLVSARFSIRNDSKDATFEIKQSGARDDSALLLRPGDTAPFYWADFRLPRLVCVRPVDELETSKVYRWSGGFDACHLGLTSLLIRQTMGAQRQVCKSGQKTIRTIRTLVELRPGTGGTGINISFKEEREDGEGALFRIENRSSFQIWMSQDGVLADPSTTGPHDVAESDGDLIRPGERKSFGLDVPYRQGKYAHRQAATMSELLHVRVGLAPLSTRAGIESTKVIGLAIIGESIRLKPSKLVTVLSVAERKGLDRVRVLGVTTADGPSRVLKFCMMAIPEAETSLQSVLRDSVLYEPPKDPLPSGPHAEAIGQSAVAAESLLIAQKLPNESEAKRQALFGSEGGNDGSSPAARKQEALDSTMGQADTRYSIRVSFSGFLFSLMDSAPSEICTIAINQVNAMAKWNMLRSSDASFLMSIGWLQVDNHIPSAPFPVAFCPASNTTNTQGAGDGTQRTNDSKEPSSTPLLFVGIEMAPKHSSGIVCLKSCTIAPRSLEVSLDLAFLVRLQRFAMCVQAHFQQTPTVSSGEDLQQVMASQLQLQRATPLPDLSKTIESINNAVATGVGRQQIYFGALAILNFTIFLSVAPARALTAAQAAIEGMEASAIHKAVRKGDFNLGRSTPLGVVIGRKNRTARAVAMGVMKSIVVDALIRMDGASLNLSGAFLRNQIFYGPQLTTYMAAHYMYSMRQNLPAILGSMAAIGNPLGLFRGIGDGVHDFVNEPVKGLKKSIQKLDPQYMVDGVARGTGSLARHTVGGFADSAALLTSTFSKNMAVLTLDRRYAQKRDRGNHLRYEDQEFFLLAGVESGFVKLAQGFIEGVTGVVRAPIRGAEKSGFEGFAKGLGKGLLGLLVKPMIGISDAATDVFIGVKTSVEGDGHHVAARPNQVRPRRALYGRDKHVRLYDLGDAAASALMLRTRIGGQCFLSHLDMNDRVALLSDKRLLLLDSAGKELLLVKFKHISNVEVHEFEKGSWSILVMLNSPRENGSEVEVITCKDHQEADELCGKIKEGMNLVDRH